MKVGKWSCYSVGRPPAKFHRIRSSFDAPTDNYSGIIAGLTLDVFGLRKQSPGLSSSHLVHQVPLVPLSRCDAPRPMCQVSSSYSLLLPCHSLACCILSCHHVHCIILFSKPASVRVPPVPSVVRSEPRHTCTRPWHVRNSSRNGMRVGVGSCYSVGRPPAKFHRIRSSFDSPTDNYSDSLVGLTSDVFGLRKQMPGPLSLLPLAVSP